MPAHEAYSITATRGQYGQWCLSAIVDGYLVQRQYYDYTKREAMQLFRAETSKERSQQPC